MTRRPLLIELVYVYPMTKGSHSLHSQPSYDSLDLNLWAATNSSCQETWIILTTNPSFNYKHYGASICYNETKASVCIVCFLGILERTWGVVDGANCSSRSICQDRPEPASAHGGNDPILALSHQLCKSHPHISTITYL